LSEDDPFIKVAQGYAQGTLNWTKDQIKAYAKGVVDKKYSFIEDERHIDIVKDSIKSQEWKIISDYINDRKLKPLILSGISLRKLEDDKDELHKLKDNIYAAHGRDGVHIAEMVQNGIFTQFINDLVGLDVGKKDIIRFTEKLIDDVRSYSLFISSDDSLERRIEQIKIKILGMNIDFLILFASDSAVSKLDEIVEKLKNEDYFKDYEIKTHIIETKSMKKTVFLYNTSI
jgi:hypothetical protein